MRAILYFVFLLHSHPVISASPWQSLTPGMDLGTFSTSQPSRFGDSRITILRIDPDLWSLEFVGISRDGGRGRTARQWSEIHAFTAVINAGMFATDYKTHVGYLRFRDHVNNGRVNQYQSVAAFDPRHKGLSRFRIFDLDNPGINMETILREAALGEDESGRILFIFCRSPYTMHDLNNELLGLDIGLVSAQHLEGGPEAQLYLRAGEVELEFSGSYETSFRENNDISIAWPIPNILGVQPRALATK
jgi:hypothetical protein